MLSCCRYVILLLFFSLFISGGLQARTFDINEFYLDNGLQVIVVENHKAPIVKQMLFYKVGAVDEKIGKGGIAHLLEHLMFRGTKDVKGQNFNILMEQNGAESNAFTGHDVTAYHQFLDISRLELAMFLEADRMQNLNFAQKDFYTERNIVFQERKQRVDNNPTALFGERLRAVLWQDHPYGHPITGKDEEIQALELKDAIDFYEQYYVANNAVLVLAGDIDLQTAKKLANKYYGKLKKGNITKKDMPVLAGDYRAKVEMSLPDVRMGRLVMMFATDSFVSDKNSAYALDVLSQYLGGDENSPFYQKLVLRDKKAHEVAVDYDGVARSYGNFVVSVVPVGLPDRDFEISLDKAWDEAVEKLDEKELTKVKKKMLAGLVYLEDNPESLAMMVGYLAAVGLKKEDLQNYAEMIENVSVEDVKKAAKKLKNDTPQVIGALYPEGELP